MGYGEKSDLSERIYITKRKGKALLHGLVFYMCRVFPVKSNKVVMWTFECGGGYGCSPKYVAEELLKQNREKGSDYEIFWLVDDMNKEFPEKIRKIKNTLWNRAYHMSTAGTWVANTRTFYGTRKRKNQCYIQTWHATMCIKPIGKYRKSRLPKMAYIVSRYDSGLIDWVLSGSRWCNEMYRDGLIYKGRIVKTGTPRCDVLINQKEEKHRQMREEYCLPSDGKILLYAPTFRGGSQSGKRSVNTEETTVDLKRLIETLERKFGGVWYVFLRLHPQLAAKMEKIQTGQMFDRLIDVSQRPDMNEIIAGADAFLTDYSSAIFEAAMAGMPGFIYADDLEEYVKDRGELMFDIDKLPFSAAWDNDGLTANILEFDMEKYKRDVEAFMTDMGNREDGQSSKRVVELIKRSKVDRAGNRT